MIDSHHGWNTSYKPVAIGFFVSLICTLAAYFIVSKQVMSTSFAMPLVAVLGLLQTLFQVVFFFHIGKESKPRWNLLMFLFMALVVFLIVGGSIWIMYNLNYNTMM